MTEVASAALGITTIVGEPFLIALLASSLCGLGLAFLNEQSSGSSAKSSKSHIGILSRIFITHRQEIVYASISGSAVTVLVLLWTNSLVITLPFSFFSLVITWVYLRNKSARVDAAMMQVWPEVIDHLISGIHSGLSLSEAMVGLGNRGPELLRPAFLEFHQDLLRKGDFAEATQKLKVRFNAQGSDQILEAILLAKSLGGSELLQIFRTLGDFLRQDLALRKEIEIKHGWIKNSAHLSSAAPWLLLLLLSSQPGTAQAFAQPGGVAILFLGIFLTILAYFWMGRLGRLPRTPRVFG
ncbi:MAG: type II secretion system protein F [Actinomycetota bacterium]